MSIGYNLKKAREKKNISQKEVARILNISRQSISKWENNRNLPDIDNLVRLSEIYEISIDELLKNDTLVDQSETVMHQVRKQMNNYEWLLLLILCVLLSLAVPLGLIFVPFILFRNKKNTVYKKLIIFACIICILINIYCLFVYVGDYIHMQQEIEVINKDL